MNRSIETSRNGRRVRVEFASRDRRVTLEGTATRCHDALLGRIVRIRIDSPASPSGLPPVLCIEERLFQARARHEGDSDGDLVLDLT